MNISRNVSLKKYNTFGIDAHADYFVEVNSSAEIIQILQDDHLKSLDRLIIGGGSNILLTRDFPGLVIKNNLKGISIVNEDVNSVWVRSAAGESWHSFVLWTLDHNLNGAENLSLIPGSVGAGPMQNIGAYGVELKDLFFELEALNVETLESRIFTHQECKFGYRESVFKHEVRNQFFITSVTFKLNKIPNLNTSYGAIAQELSKEEITNPSSKDISNAVIRIRQSKLPDPAVLGNAGSFFKNPEIPTAQFNELKIKFPEIVGYPLANERVKLAAGWMIEQCGWKGKRVGDTGSHKDQALVLVNYGNAKGADVYELALQIRESVIQKFGVRIDPEVNLI
ncbi:UDP-N-acetylmuramate dehydrogenase [soil metagenome]